MVSWSAVIYMLLFLFFFNVWRVCAGTFVLCYVLETMEGLTDTVEMDGLFLQIYYT